MGSVLALNSFKKGVPLFWSHLFPNRLLIQSKRLWTPDRKEWIRFNQERRDLFECGLSPNSWLLLWCHRSRLPK